MYESGIYKITAPNGHFYIGSTTRTFKRRWIEHKTELRHHKHRNPVLQAAWDKYGEENMIFEVIQRCPSENCARLEQMALETFRPFYNLSMDTKASFKGRKHTDVAKEKCRLVHLGKKKPPKTKEHSANQSAAQLGRKVSQETINKILSTKARIAKERGGYFSPEGLQNIKNTKHASGYKHKPRSEEHRKALSLSKIGKKTGSDNPAARSIRCVETGEVFSTVKDAATWIQATKNPNASRCNISSCCTKKLKTAYGYHWEYADSK